MSGEFPLDYWGLKHRRIYECSRDSRPSMFEYRLLRNQVQYRKTGTRLWTHVWNIEYWSGYFRVKLPPLRDTLYPSS